MEKNSIFLSVVIPTRNSLNFLRIIIPSMLSQNYAGSMEIVIADNQSTDGTQDYCEKLGCTVINIEGVAPQACMQRNEGIKKAKGEYILILDHDMEFEPNFFKILKDNVLKKLNIVAWYVPEKVTCQTKILTTIRNFENRMFAKTPVAATRLFKKTLFNSIGYYDENLSDGPGDWDFDMKVHISGYDVDSIDTHVIHHEEGLSLTKYISKKQNYVAGSLRYKEKWKNTSEARLRLNKQFSIVYRCFGFIDSAEKLKYISFHPHEYLIYLAITFAKGTQYIAHKLSV